MTVWRRLRGHQGVIGFVILAVGNAVALAQLDGLRHDQCVSGRRDTQTAFNEVAVVLDADDETRDLVAETVSRVLPVDEC